MKIGSFSTLLSVSTLSLISDKLKSFVSSTGAQKRQVLELVRVIRY